MFIFSPNNIQVSELNITIPIPKPIKRDGQRSPSNASAKLRVAKIETYETATPGNAIKIGCVLAQLEINCKWD
jgi:hypothetical protein